MCCRIRPPGLSLSPEATRNRQVAQVLASPPSYRETCRSHPSSSRTNQIAADFESLAILYPFMLLLTEMASAIDCTVYIIIFNIAVVTFIEVM